MRKLEALATKQSIDQFSRFLEPTLPPGQLDYFNPRKPLVGKETSVANIQREDTNSYLFIEEAILEFLEEGQIGLARFLMMLWLSELKLTMSFDGKFMEFVGTHKFEYTQKQDITEHVHPLPKKKGWFRRG